MGLQQIGIEAILKDDQFQAGLRRFHAGIDQMNMKAEHGAGAISKIGSIASGAVVAGMAAATAAIAGLVAAMKIGLDTTLEWSESMDRLGDQFGMSGEEASKWTVAMQHVGLSVEEGTFGLNFFTRGLAETTKMSAKGEVTLTPFGEALAKLGVKAYDAKGKLKTFDQVMPEIMDAFQKMPSGVTASNLAMELFGARGGSKFLDFLRQGSKGLKDAEKFAREFGLELTTEEVNAAEDFGFAMNDLNMELKGLWNIVGRQVLPIARQFVNFVKDNILPVLAKWEKDNLPSLMAQLQNFGNFLRVNILPVLQTLYDAFKRIGEAYQKGGIAGMLGQIGTEIKNAWPAIQAQLATWKDQFWEWLTGKNGKGGALQAAGDKIGAVISEMGTYMRDHVDDFIAIFHAWTDNFWDWLTNPSTGAITHFGLALRNFSFQAANYVRTHTADVQNIGEEIATGILDGLRLGLSDTKKQTPVINSFAYSLGETIAQSGYILDMIGTSLVRGIMVGIYKQLGVSEADANRIAATQHPYSWQTVQWMLQQQQQQQYVPFSSTGSQNRSNGLGFQHGGWVPYTGPIFAHAGEYVLTAQQARMLLPPSVTNVRHGPTLNFYHTWNGAPASFDRRQVEAVAENAAYNAVTQTLEGYRR